MEDVVSRDDFAHARREGWTRVQTAASEIMHLAKSVNDLFYAVDAAALDLVSCFTSWLAEPARGTVGLGAPGGAEMRTRCRL